MTGFYALLMNALCNRTEANKLVFLCVSLHTHTHGHVFSVIPTHLQEFICITNGPKSLDENKKIFK